MDSATFVRPATSSRSNTQIRVSAVMVTSNDPGTEETIRVVPGSSVEERISYAGQSFASAVTVRSVDGTYLTAYQTDATSAAVLHTELSLWVSNMPMVLSLPVLFLTHVNPLDEFCSCSVEDLRKFSAAPFPLADMDDWGRATKHVSTAAGDTHRSEFVQPLPLRGGRGSLRSNRSRSRSRSNSRTRFSEYELSDGASHTSDGSSIMYNDDEDPDAEENDDQEIEDENETAESDAASNFMEDDGNSEYSIAESVDDDHDLDADDNYDDEKQSDADFSNYDDDDDESDDVSSVGNGSDAKPSSRKKRRPLPTKKKSLAASDKKKSV